MFCLKILHLTFNCNGTWAARCFCILLVLNFTFNCSLLLQAEKVFNRSGKKKLLIGVSRDCVFTIYSRTTKIMIIIILNVQPTFVIKMKLF